MQTLVEASVQKMKHLIIDWSIGTRRQNFSGTVISCAKSDWRIMFAVLMPAKLDGIITRVQKMYAVVMPAVRLR